MSEYILTPLRKNKSKNPLNVSIIINSFNGNIEEYSKSQNILHILKSKQIPIYEIVDINQEMVFNQANKIKSNIRQHYHEKGYLYYINSKLDIPQAKIGKHLLVNYEQFINLLECNVLDRIIANDLCDHVRFFQDQIAYVKTENDIEMCIYCYSKKKVNPKFQFFVPWRNSNDETIDDILSFCEENKITLVLNDIENRICSGSDLHDFSKPFFIFDNEKFQLDAFYDIVDKKIKFLMIGSAGVCEICEERIEASLYDMRKCLNCLVNYNSEISKNSSMYTLSNNSSNHKYSNEKYRNSNYCFVEKLNLKKTTHYRSANKENVIEKKLEFGEVTPDKKDLQVSRSVLNFSFQKEEKKMSLGSEGNTGNSFKNSFTELRYDG